LTTQAGFNELLVNFWIGIKDQQTIKIGGVNMGLDAFVKCNCGRLGLTSKPPFPRSCLELDQEGQLKLRPEFNNEDYRSSFWE
jgi:hypothetical protein